MPTIPKKFNPHPFAYHQELILRVDTVTNLGEGLGRVDGWVVMVPFVAKGELVKVRVWNNRGSFSQADLVEVLEPSASRIEPKCPLFGVCGGCQYQHLSYTEQLELKRGHLKEVYARIGGMDVEVSPTIPSPLEWGYRTKLTPHYGPVRRIPPDVEKEDFNDFPIGFLSTQGKTIVDVPTCPIATAAINTALPEVRQVTMDKKGFVKRDGTLLLRESVCSDGGIEIITDFRVGAAETVNGIAYDFISGEFFQVNRSILPAFSAAVLDHMTTPYLVDTYCGVGFFALQAAKRCKQVMGVEVSKIAVDKAIANAAANHLDNVQFVAESAEAIFAQVGFPAAETTVVMDPPRSGATEAFLNQLVAFGPARVIYVACDPATQARDAKILVAKGYKLTSLVGADLFPQTRHIEAIAVFEKAIIAN